LLPAAATLVALVLSLTALRDAKYNADERQWIYQGEQAWRHLRTGHLDAPYWTEFGMLWGWPSPPVAKYVIGFALQAAGKESPQREGTTKAMRARLKPFPTDVLWAARVPSAVFGAIGIFFFFLVARRVANEWVALLGSVSLATSPVWLASSRRAMVDIYGIALTIVALYIFILARERQQRGETIGSTLMLFAGTGVTLGLAVGAKLSAAGAATGLGMLLFVDLVRPGAARGKIVAAGLTLAICAVVVFVGSNPYLHHDTWARFTAIFPAWEGVVDGRIENNTGLFKNAYRPGLASLREAAEVLLLPARAATPWLLLPVVGATLTWTAVGRRFPADTVHLAVWLLAVPAVVAGAFSPGHFVHVWITWVGVVGWVSLVLAGRPGGDLDASRRRAATAVAVAALGSLAFILATTYVTWPRYYLPVIPALVLGSAVSLYGLGALLVRHSGRVGAIPVVAAVVFGFLSVTTTYPDSGNAKTVKLLAAGRGSPGHTFLVGSVASFSLFLLPLVIVRRGRADSSRGV
jgi:4-amino-4-deoxy-L-arabinose transferase-like glycosyltransferase